MCGGEGTRLRPLTFDRPKPCIPIVNTPSILHLVSHLSHLGFTDIVVTLGYKGDEIIEALGDGSLFGVKVTYIHDRIKLGTAGSVRNARQYLDGAPFVVVGGDHVTNIDLLAFYREHLASDSMITIGLISIDDPCEYGIAEIDANYQIRRFKEKPAPGEIFSNLASTGIYVCNPDVFDHIPPQTQFDFAKDLFPALMRERYIVKGWLARGNWTDVGSPRSLRQAERWKLQELSYTTITGNFTVKGSKILGPVRFGGSVTIGANSKVIGPLSIGAGTVIGDDVIVGPYTSIGDGCHIGRETKIFSSSIYNEVSIGEAVTISGSIIDNNANIGNLCHIENDTVIGPRSTLKDGAVVHSGTRIWPEVVVPAGTIVKEHLLNEAFDLHYRGS
jgi:mannose-1-phosphate guanylyltransferase